MRTLDEESRLSSPERESEGASERRFVLSLTQDAPDRDRRQTEGGGGVGDSGFGSARPRPREIDLSPRYVHQEAGLAKPCPVCRTPGCRPSAFLSPSFPSCGVEVFGSANCHVNHRGIMRARRSPLSVLPLQKSDGEGALNFTGHAAGRLVRVRRRASRTLSFLPSLFSSST